MKDCIKIFLNVVYVQQNHGVIALVFCRRDSFISNITILLLFLVETSLFFGHDQFFLCVKKGMQISDKTRCNELGYHVTIAITTNKKMGEN